MLPASIPWALCAATLYLFNSAVKRCLASIERFSFRSLCSKSLESKPMSAMLPASTPLARRSANSYCLTFWAASAWA